MSDAVERAIQAELERQERTDGNDWYQTVEDYGTPFRDFFDTARLAAVAADAARRELLEALERSVGLDYLSFSDEHAWSVTTVNGHDQHETVGRGNDHDSLLAHLGLTTAKEEDGTDG